MGLEFVFRTLAGGILLIGLVVRTYFKRKYKKIERDTPRGGKRDKVYYYVVLVSFLFVFLYAATNWLDVAHVGLSLAFRFSGVVIGFVSLGLLLVCHRSLGINWSGVVQLTKNHSMVTSGPYRHIRHPMYTSLFGSALGFALMSANWLIAIVQR